RVLSCDYIQVDESTLPVVDNEKKRAVKGYVWAVRSPVTGELFFHYDRGSRSEKTAMVLLHNFKGAIQTDGYQVVTRKQKYSENGNRGTAKSGTRIQ
ncbi:MAG: transposase, partial [Bacteroidaceae bacterium]